MNSSYQKLNLFQTITGNRLTNMSGRTPSFIVVGLVIIMFLLGLFYMSCSSKNTELRLSVEQFEERIRSLTIKHSDAEKKIETISSRKHELEEEKLNIQKQMEKKDSEINDLNTKLNEKSVELQGLKSDKNVLDEQLKEYKSMSETLSSKTSLIEKLQQQLYDQKQSGNDELTRLKQEYELLKNKQPSQNNQLPSNNEQQGSFQIPQDRFRPLMSNNSAAGNIGSLLKNQYNKLNNLTQEIKEQIAPIAIDVKDTVLNVIGINTNSSTTVTVNEQQGFNNDVRQNQQIGQNVPAPPLDNNNNVQQGNRVESIQGADQFKDDDQVAIDNPRYLRRRSVNRPVIDNRDVKPSNGIPNDDKEQHDIGNVQENSPSSTTVLKQNNLDNDDHHHPIDAPSPPSILNNDNYRIGDRKHVRQQQQSDKGEEIDNDDEDNQEDEEVRKKNLV